MSTYDNRTVLVWHFTLSLWYIWNYTTTFKEYRYNKLKLILLIWNWLYIRVKELLANVDKYLKTRYTHSMLSYKVVKTDKKIIRSKYFVQQSWSDSHLKVGIYKDICKNPPHTIFKSLMIYQNRKNCEFLHIPKMRSTYILG